MTRNTRRRHLGSRLQTLRAFQVECWTLGWVGLYWLAVTDMWTSFGDFVPNSNAALLFLFALVAGLAGGRALQLRDWGTTVLVPGFATSLFWTCVFFLPAAGLIGMLQCWLAGNTQPSLGPGVLVAAIVLLCGVSFGRQTLGYIVAVCFFSIAAVGTMGDGFLTALSRHTSQLSDTRVQVGSLALAVIVLAYTKRAFGRPTRRRGARPDPQYSANMWWQPAVFQRDEPRVGPPLPASAWRGRRLGKEVALGAVAFGVAFALWVALPSLVPDEILVVPWLVAIALAPLRLLNVHRDVSFAWIHGTTPSRAALGRQFVVRVAVLTAPWLVVGVVGTTVHAQYAGGGSTFLEELMVVQIAALVAVALGCRAPRLPSARSVWFVCFVVGVVTGASATLGATAVDFGFVGFAALVLALGCGVALLLVVGARGLARAEIVQ